MKRYLYVALASIVLICFSRFIGPNVSERHAGVAFFLFLASHVIVSWLAKNTVYGISMIFFMFGAVFGAAGLMSLSHPEFLLTALILGAIVLWCGLALIEKSIELSGVDEQKLIWACSAVYFLSIFLSTLTSSPIVLFVGAGIFSLWLLYEHWNDRGVVPVT